MIDMKMRICFSIINLTEFDWHELQDTAARILSDYMYHTLPQTFEFSHHKSVTYQDQDLSVFTRRNNNAVEFLFVQPSRLTEEANRAHAVSLAG